MYYEKDEDTLVFFYFLPITYSRLRRPIGSSAAVL